MAEVGARAIGARVLRAEDPRILTGHGRYVDDVVLPDMLHAAFKRSTVPHGRLVSVDVSAARALPGVVAVYTGEDLARFTNPAAPGGAIGMHLMPGLRAPAVLGLATDKVRYVGDPIAIVVAEDRYLAEDAVELIEESIEFLEPVVTYEDAFDPAKPPLFDEFDDNIAYTSERELGDVDAAFAQGRPDCRGEHLGASSPAGADGVPRTHCVLRQRCRAPDDPLGDAVAAHDPDPPAFPGQRADGEDQGPGRRRRRRVRAEERRPARRGRRHRGVHRPRSAGEVDRGPARAPRGGGQAREEGADIEAAVTADGVLLGVRISAKLNLGAYASDPFSGAIYIDSLGGSFQGPTKIEGVGAKNTAVFSNKATYVAYRGPWATGDFLRERMLDVIARELELDPLEIRRRNYVERDVAPLAMLTGQPFVGVTTREQVEQAAVVTAWDDFRRRQAEARREGRYLGIGMASYLEAAPGPKIPGQEDMAAMIMGQEVAKVSLGDDGTIVIITRQQPHGQSHETTLAQVAVDELSVRFEDVRVVFGDTDVTPMALVGTGGSRAATLANGAVLHGSRELRAKILSLAADFLEASAEDLEITEGVISVKGSPVVQLPMAELARIVAHEPERFPDGADTELDVTQEYDGGQSGWSGGTHVAEVEVDIETGLVTIGRYVVVEDCGLPVNPAIVEGQIRGGVAQGIGAVLLEHSAYDGDGQFMASTFMDYLMPTTMDVPNFEIHHVEPILTDPDVNFRGVGEGGMIVAPACITNAIEDALAPLGVKVREQHLPPSRILSLAGVVPE